MEKMNVDVLISAAEAVPERVEGRVAAVMDVFRATSVLVQSLHNGAAGVIPVVSVEEALSIADRYGCRNVILGGERGTFLIEGFDKDNSPLAYTRSDVEGKMVVQTTTNGTRAIYNSSAASAVYVAAFLNIGAVCRRMASHGMDMALVCAGRKDRFTAEDGLCAGAMASILRREYGCVLSDIAGVMAEMYENSRHDLRGRLSSTLHYNFMLRQGYHDDIEFCLRHDIYDIVPRYGADGIVTIEL